MDKKYTVTYSFGGGSDLFNAMDTQRILDEHDKLESQLRTTSLAVRMLKNIGVKCK
jgi:hypothetical protein